MSLSISRFVSSPALKFGRCDAGNAKPPQEDLSENVAGRQDVSRVTRIRRDIDTVEMSGETSPASRGKSDVRGALVSSIRELIAQGAYDTPDRLDAATEALLASL